MKPLIPLITRSYIPSFELLTFMREQIDGMIEITYFEFLFFWSFSKSF